MIYILLILIGLFVGTYGSIIGIGGGLFLIPLLSLIYPEMNPLTITGISITVATVTTFVSFTSYTKQNRVDFKNGIFLMIGAVPMTFVGVLLVSNVSTNLFSLLFAGLVLLIACFIIYKNLKKNDIYTPKSNEKLYTLRDSLGNEYVYPFNRPLATFASMIGGFLPGFFGISGGIIRVPFMTYVLHVPVKVATATSQFVLFFTSLASVIAHLLSKSYEPDWIIILSLVTGIIPGAKIGSKLSSKIPSKAITTMLAAALILCGVKMLLNSI